MRRSVPALCLLAFCSAGISAAAAAFGQATSIGQAAPAIALAAPTNLAGDAVTCNAGNGTLLVATVVANQGFFAGLGQKQGISLSHTRLLVSADSDGSQYQVAMDDIFADDYVANAPASPASLQAIKPGDHLELCGVTYTNPAGIHYVHTNCGTAPQKGQADGWVEEIDADGNTASNLESSRQYCFLFD